MMDLVEHLLEYQKEHNMNISNLSKKLDISHSLLYRILFRQRELTSDTEEKISIFLGCRYNVSIPLNVLEKIKQNQPELEGIIKDLLQANGSNEVGFIEQKISELINGDYLELSEMYGLSQCRAGKEYKNE